MTRNELRGLTALIVLVAAGLGAQAWMRWHRAGLVWEEESLVAPARAEVVERAEGLLDLNRATAAEIEVLPGVGPVTARAIVDTRDRAGAFASIDDIRKVPGVGPATVERLRSHVRVETPERERTSAIAPATTMRPVAAQPPPEASATPASPTTNPAPKTAPETIDINSASVEALQTLWNVGPKTAAKIVAWREANGGFEKPRDLIKVHGIGVKTFERNSARVRVGPFAAGEKP